MLQCLSEKDLLRMEFADFCRERGDKDYDYTSYVSCAFLQFMQKQGHVPYHHQHYFYGIARQRPWNFKALAERLGRNEG